MLNIYSIRINLEDFIGDEEREKIILENLRFCKNHVGKLFLAIFKHNKLDEKIIKEFVKRHTNLLFEIGIDITTEDTFGWFVIGDDNIVNWRYKWTGEILEGLVEYRNLVQHLIEKKSE